MKLIYSTSFAGLLFCCVVSSCAKPDKGFISDNIYYKENPLNASQGSTTVSQPLEADGSTFPLTVSLLKVTNKTTGQVADSLLLQAKDIKGYSGNVTFADSTVNGLLAKITQTKVAPLTINKIGGRIQLTPATVAVPAGTYSIDVMATNVRGSRTITNACDIVIQPTEYVKQLGAAYNYLLDTTTADRIYTTPEISVVRNPAGASEIIFKWVDETGRVFNPAAGEVLTRDGLASFVNWDPYYPVKLTDTTFVFTYPAQAPSFPVFNPARVGGGTQTDYWCYYQIPAKFLTAGRYARTGFTLQFPNVQGSYTITIKEWGVRKK
jgi:hypothetical protein